jgi:hypothetical protein
MAKLTYGQVLTLATSVGMKEPRKMAAIAMAESEGDTNAHNPKPPDNSYGLWQINMLNEMGPARRKQFGIATNEALYNPLTNALAAKKVYASQGFGAWSTYGGEKYNKYLTGGGSAEPVDQASAETAGVVPDVAGSVADVASLSLDAARWISTPNNWLRITYVTGGIVVVIVALRTLMAPVIDKAASGAMKVATNLPAGKAAKAVKGMT